MRMFFFQVIFLFPVFWKHHEDDTNVLPYCTIIVDSKGGWPCEKAWYSKCLYLMVCNEIEKGLHHPLVETFIFISFSYLIYEDIRHPDTTSFAASRITLVEML